MRIFRYALTLLLLLGMQPAFAAVERPLHEELEDAWNAYLAAIKARDLDRVKATWSARGYQVARNEVVASRAEFPIRLFDAVSTDTDLTRLKRAQTTKKGQTASSIYYFIPPAESAPPAVGAPARKEVPQVGYILVLFFVMEENLWKFDKKIETLITAELLNQVLAGKDLEIYGTHVLPTGVIEPTPVAVEPPDYVGNLRISSRGLKAIVEINGTKQTHLNDDRIVTIVGGLREGKNLIKITAAPAHTEKTRNRKPFVEITIRAAKDSMDLWHGSHQAVFAFRTSSTQDGITRKFVVNETTRETKMYPIWVRGQRPPPDLRPVAKPIQVLKPNAETATKEELFDVGFSPDGTMFATAESTNTKLWDVGTGKVKQTLRSTEGQVRRLAFSPDGKWLAGGGESNYVVVWDAKAGTLKRTLKGRITSVSRLHFTANGRLVCAEDRKSSSLDERLSVEVWDIETAQAKSMYVGFEVPVLVPGGISYAFEAIDDRGYSGWELRDAVTDKTIRRLQQRPRAFSANGQIMLTLQEDEAGYPVDGIYMLWDIGTGRQLSVLNDAPRRRLKHAVFSPDGKLLVMATSSNSGFVMPYGEFSLWNTTTGKLRWIGKQEAEVKQVVFSRDGKNIASASEDGTVKLWDANADGTVQK